MCTVHQKLPLKPKKQIDLLWMKAYQFSSVQLLSRVWLFVTPWTTACQASLSITNSWNLLKLMSIESVMPSNHLILCCPLLLLPLILPSIRVFRMSQLFTSGDQSIGVSPSTSVLPMKIQDWFPLGWTGLISLLVQGTLKSLFQRVQWYRRATCPSFVFLKVFYTI